MKAVEKGAATPRTPWPDWGFWPKFLLVMLLFYAFYYGDLLLLKSCHIFLVPLVGSQKASFYYYTAVTFCNALTYIVIAYWSLKLFNLSLADIGWKKVSWPRLFVQIGAGVALAVFQIRLIEFAVYHFRDLYFYGRWPIKFWFTLSPRADLLGSASFADPIFWANNISWILLGGFMEELVNHGILYAALRTKLSPLGAILITALYFSLSHIFSYAPLPSFRWLFSTFIFGIFLGCLREWSETLWGPMTAHWLVDFSGYWLAWN